MNVLVTRDLLLEKCARADEYDEAFDALRSFVFDHYYAEDDYTFEEEVLEDIFAVLAPYFESEEAFGDPRKHERLHRLCTVLRHARWSPEHVFFTLYFDEIKELSMKRANGEITSEVFMSQLERLSPVNLHLKEVARLAQEHRTYQDVQPEILS